MDTTEQTKGLSSGESGQASAGSEGTPPQPPRTYSEEEIQKVTKKAVNDALAQAGRDAKTLAEKEAAVKAQQGTVADQLKAIEDWQKQRDAEELAAARSDPVKLTAYQLKQQERTRKATLEAQASEIAKRDAALKEREDKIAEREKTHAQIELEDAIWEISAEAYVNPTILKDTMTTLGLTTIEQARALAKTLNPAGQRPPEGQGKEGQKLTPASGISAGAGKPSNEQLDKLPMDDYAAVRKKQMSTQL